MGESGSGKSTIVGLIERFYDVNEGQVLLDGRDIKEYNLQWLRQNVSLLGREAQPAVAQAKCEPFGFTGMEGIERKG